MLEASSFFQGKSWDTFGPTGPCLVTADEVDDPQDLNVRLWVNGRLRQDFSTSDMAYNIARCIEWASGITKLEPGDILATGTNHQGLGAMQDGDVIEMHIDGLDKLTINVQRRPQARVVSRNRPGHRRLRRRPCDVRRLRPQLRQLP